MIPQPLAVVSLLALFFVVPRVHAQSRPAHAPIELGDVAPAIGNVQWVALGSSETRVPPLSSLQGDVVVVHTYTYFHDGSQRVGVPLINALRRANAPDDLHVVVLTALVAQDTLDKVRAEAGKLGLAGPIGWCDTDGVTSPYFDVAVNGSMNFAFVIGRNGRVVWKGDTARERDVFLAALSSALQRVSARALPTASPLPELAPAARAYALGDFAQCEALAQVVQKRVGSRADGAPLRAAASELLALVEGTRADLVAALEAASGAKDAAAFARASVDLGRTFPKSAAARRADALELELARDAAFTADIRRWRAWYELEAARPATFPAEKNVAAQKYARELGQYAKQPDAPGLARVREWLDDYALLK